MRVQEFVCIQQVLLYSQRMYTERVHASASPRCFRIRRARVAREVATLSLRACAAAASSVSASASSADTGSGYRRPERIHAGCEADGQSRHQESSVTRVPIAYRLRVELFQLADSSVGRVDHALDTGMRAFTQQLAC